MAYSLNLAVRLSPGERVYEKYSTHTYKHVQNYTFLIYVGCTQSIADDCYHLGKANTSYMLP